MFMTRSMTVFSLSRSPSSFYPTPFLIINIICSLSQGSGHKILLEEKINFATRQEGGLLTEEMGGASTFNFPLTF